MATGETVGLAKWFMTLILLNLFLTQADVREDMSEQYYNKLGDFRVTHQATANMWSLYTHMVSVVERFVVWAPMLAFLLS